MLASATMLLAAAFAAPQDLAPRELVEAFSDPALVRGRIVGAGGEPLPEGSVQAWFELEPASRLDSATVIEVLRQTPLPPLRVFDDGSLVLPLTEMHRARLGPSLGRWWLVVEAEGHLPWRQPLDRGLAGIVSVDATLQPLTDGDVLGIDLQAAGLPAGDAPRTALVRHWIRKSAGGRAETWSLEQQQLDIGESSCRVLVLAAPNPPWWDGAGLDAGIVEWGAQLLVYDAGAGTLRAAELMVEAADAPRFESLAGPIDDETLRFVSDAGAALPLDRLRVTLSGPYGAFEVRPDATGGLRVPKGHRATLVVAPGHRAQTELPPSGTVVLESIDDEVALEILVHDVEGRGVPRAEVVLEPIVTALDDRPIRLPVPKRLFRGRTNSEGLVEVPVRALAEPGLLRIDADGFRSKVHIDPRPHAGIRRLESGVSALDSAPLRVTVVDPERAPVSQALVVAPIRRSSGSFGRPRLARTDSEGVAELPIDPGSVRDGLLVFASSHLATEDRQLDLSTGAVELSVVPARTVGLVVVDEEGLPVPGAWFQEPSRHGHGDESGADLEARPVSTGARGRTWLRLAADTSSVQLSQRLFRSEVSTSSHDVDGEYIEVRSGPLRSVRLLGASGSWFARLAHLRGGGASTGGVTTPPEGPRSGVFLTRWRPGAGVELRVGTAHGPPLRVTDAGVEVGEVASNGLVTLDYRRPRRSVPLRVTLDGEDGGLDLREARVEYQSPHFSGAMYSNAMGNLLRVDEQGRAFLDLWDPSAAKFRLLHPALKVIEFEVGDEPGPDEVALTGRPGQRVRLRMGVDSAGIKPLYLTVDSSNPGATLRFQELIEVNEADAARGFFDWSLPAAVDAGTHKIDVHGDVTAQREQEITVEDGAAGVTIDLRPKEGD